MNYKDFLKELESVERGSALKFMNKSIDKGYLICLFEQKESPSSILKSAFIWDDETLYWGNIFNKLQAKEQNELL